MHLAEQFRDYIRKQSLFATADQLIIAVSGGVDSIVLCELCSLSGFSFAIAHCNFQLRGEESEADEKFVKEISEKYQAILYSKRFDTNAYAAEKKVSIQVAARELRYSWFEELLNEQSQKGTSFILTAHHLDDNIETLLMNFFKGTGIAGLRGMLPKNKKIIRPLLFARKEEIEEFALQNNLKWREDSSNKDDKYSRNYIRRQLIPVISQIYPSALENIGQNLERFRDIETIYHRSIDQQITKLVEHKGNEIHIPVLKLKKLEALPTVIFEIIKKYGFKSSQVQEVINLLESESGKYILSDTHRILKNRNWIIIAAKDKQLQENILIEENDKIIRFEAGELRIEILPGQDISKLDFNDSIAFLDVTEIEFPVLLRKWKPGDYFYPLGMKKKKKLARFFIDHKLSLLEKEQTWVIEINKKIVWIVGKRIDDRVKVTDYTKSILKIQFTSSA